MESLFNVDNVVDWLSHFGIWAIIISILLNIFISIIGILPSVFLSSANAILFGLPLGFAISLCGETIGAFVTYCLYRKGITTLRKHKSIYGRWSIAFSNASPIRQFFLMLIARFTPVIPSGVITFVGAWTGMNLYSFMIATIIGKSPSIAAEVWVGEGLYKLALRLF